MLFFYVSAMQEEQARKKPQSCHDETGTKTNICLLHEKTCFDRKAGSKQFQKNRKPE